MWEPAFDRNAGSLLFCCAPSSIHHRARYITGIQISSCLYRLRCDSGMMHWSAAGDDHVESVRLCGCMASGSDVFTRSLKSQKTRIPSPSVSVSRKNVSELMRNVRSGIRRKTVPFLLPHPEAMRFLPKTVRNKILKTDLSEVGLFCWPTFNSCGLSCSLIESKAPAY